MSQDGDDPWSTSRGTRAPVVVRDGRVNFRCLANECPTPCCGPFSGYGNSTTSCFALSFSDLYLLDSDVKRILGAGRADLLVASPEGWRLRLRPDTSCAAFVDGLCSIHPIRPAVCHAFPFDLDVFAGLSMITRCPGVNAGWSEPGDFQDAVRALLAVYRRWLAVTEQAMGRVAEHEVEIERFDQSLPEAPEDEER